MTAGTLPDFEAAAANEPQLSPRQRDVLGMIAAGKTNPEIADALGVTLDGAKWNVSEILTKLGFASREEAAAYWHWRQRPGRRLARAVRGFAALGALKWGAGAAGAAVLVVGVVVAIAAFSKDDSGPASPLRPFTLEAEVRVMGNGQPGPDGLPSFEDRDTRSFIRWWLQDASHWKWEVETVEPVLDARLTVAAADGDRVTTYVDATNAYSERPFEPLPGGYVLGPSFSAMLGPLPAPDADAFLEMLAEWGDGTTSVRVLGDELLLGRKTQVIEVDPLRTSSSGSSEGGATTTSTSGTMRIWLDPDRMVAMKTVADDPEGQSFEAVVTRLDWDSKPPASAVRFTPPAGATKSDDDDVSSGGSGGSTMMPGQRDVRLAPGFLVPDYLPDGFLQVRESSSSSGGASQPDGAEAMIAGPEDVTPRPYIQLQESRRPGGLPPSLAKGDPVDVAGRQAYRTAEGDTVHLAWAQDGLVVVLTARGVPDVELLRVAGSLREMPGSATVPPGASPTAMATPVPYVTPAAAPSR